MQRCVVLLCKSWSGVEVSTFSPHPAFWKIESVIIHIVKITKNGPLIFPHHRKQNICFCILFEIINFIKVWLKYIWLWETVTSWVISSFNVYVTQYAACLYKKAIFYLIWTYFIAYVYSIHIEIVRTQVLATNEVEVCEC